jgi:hypothetical protein
MVIYHYPYKIIKVGKFTKYVISITEHKEILIQKIFRAKNKRQEVFEDQKSIKASDFPKEVRQAALWALNDAPNLGL